jgi:hypothetical protein
MGDRVSYNLYVKDWDAALKVEIDKALSDDALGWGRPDEYPASGALWFNWDEVNVGNTYELVDALLRVVAETKRDFRFAVFEAGYYGTGISTYHIPGMGEREFLDADGDVISVNAIVRLLATDEQIRTETGVVDPTWLRRGLEELAGIKYLEAWEASSQNGATP